MATSPDISLNSFSPYLTNKMLLKFCRKSKFQWNDPVKIKFKKDGKLLDLFYVIPSCLEKVVEIDEKKHAQCNSRGRCVVRGYKPSSGRLAPIQEEEIGILFDKIIILNQNYF